MVQSPLVLVLIVLLATFPLLLAAWFYYYRKIMKAGIEYPGSSPYMRSFEIPPKGMVKLETEGKVTLLVEGLNPWAIIRKNQGPPQRIYKIRLLSDVRFLEIQNPSAVFAIRVRALCERECQTFNLT
ncbi:MAG: hypothetical protein ACP5HQ_02605 [Thermoprotei archaeon]